MNSENGRFDHQHGWKWQIRKSETLAFTHMAETVHDLF